MSEFAPKSSEFGTLLFGGGIFLVLMAVVFSLLGNYLEEAPQASSGNDLEYRLANVESDLKAVRQELRIKRNQLEVIERRKRVNENVKRVEDELKSLQRKNADLHLEILTAQEEVVSVGKRQQRYREEMREWLWPQFVGRELKEDQVVRNLNYESMRILRVDAGGIMVRHRSGVARIPVGDLSASFREELDLSLQEAREFMFRMLLKDARSKRVHAGARSGIGPTRAEILETAEKRIEAGREKITKLESLIDRAKSEAAFSRQQDRYSNVRSAPGSLETWAQRAARFDKAALVYQERLMAAILELKELDPAFVPGRR